MRSALAAILLAVSIGGCGLFPISRERAIELAAEHVSSNAVLEGAALVRLRQFAQMGPFPGRSLDDSVWAVLFRTLMAAPCPAPPPGAQPLPCPDVPVTVTVVLDAHTGDPIFTN